MPDIGNTVYDTAATPISGVSLNNNALVLSSEVDNTGTEPRPDLDDLELQINFSVAPAVGSGVTCWLVLALDGTNYADGGNGTTQPSYLPVAFFPLRNATGAQRIPFRQVPIPPGKFKYLLKNDATGQNAVASSVTLTRRSYMGYGA